VGSLIGPKHWKELGVAVGAEIYDELEWRELIYQDSDQEALRTLLAEGPQSLYCGFDPTADSLHIGSLVPLIGLRRFQLAGHRPIALMGVGTGLIGDPSGRTLERTLNEKELVDAWARMIRSQMELFLDFSPGPYQARLVNNYDWLGALSAIEFLRDVGKYFSVNFMLAKESVKSRLEQEGISYTEFSYMILQAYDFLHLAKTYECRLQVGGSDQWGNITAGIDLIRRVLSVEAHVLTFPLVTTASGAKFGKTGTGTIWLDPARTSTYDFYQYFMNVDDRDVVRFLKYFTFLTREEIGALDECCRERPERREAQTRLAFEVTALTRGEPETLRVIRASEALFGQGDLRSVDASTLAAALASAPTIEQARGQSLPPLAVLLAQAGLVKSTSEARRTITSGGAYVNNIRVEDQEYRPAPEDFLHGRYVILRRGKKSYAVVRMTD
jgi:tyrosyl-tRNA synthetase